MDRHTLLITLEFTALEMMTTGATVGALRRVTEKGTDEVGLSLGLSLSPIGVPAAELGPATEPPRLKWVSWDRVPALLNEFSL